MKKIGIVTTHRANNFGAVLQAFSLVQACRELGSDAVIFDWRNPYFEQLYHCVYRKNNSLKGTVARLLAFMSFARPMLKGYESFRELMPMSSPILHKEDLASAAEPFDAFIVGSDQVWNPINSAGNDPRGFDRANLLDFVSGKPKFAYAASIGMPCIQPRDLEPEFVSAWKTFQVITMREHEGADYVSHCLGASVDTVLDPVFLHDKSWWSRYFSSIKLPKTKYVFVYNLHRSAYMNDYARRIAKSIGGEVVSVMIGHAVHKRDWGMYSVGPADFLKLLANASAVVTSSFHASAFSVLFGRQLHLAVQESKENPNTRFSTLFRLVDMKGTETEKSGDMGFWHYDFSSGDQKKLSAERGHSLKKLEEMVK